MTTCEHKIYLLAEICDHCGLKPNERTYSTLDRLANRYIDLRNHDFTHKEAITEMGINNTRMIDAVVECYRSSMEEPEMWY